MGTRRIILSFVVVFAALNFTSATAQFDQEAFERLIAQTTAENPDERVAAFLKLAEFGDQPDKLLIPMVEAMIGADTRVGEAAQVAAESMGDSMSKYCDSQLDSDDDKQVAAAAEMIHRLGNVAIGTTPKLLALTKSDNPRRRLSGIYGLVHLKNDSPETVAVVGKFLDDPDFRIQVLACRAIATIGPPANGLAGKLKQLVDEGNVSARSHAMIALGAIGPNKEFDVVELLTKYLDAYLQPDRDRALIGLMHLGPEAARSKEKVEQLMNEVDKFVQCQAALTLWKITGDAEPTIKALIEMSKTVDLEYDALCALFEMKQAAVSAAAEIGNHLANEDGSIRAISVQTLENLGDAAGPHLATLEKMAQEDVDPLVRFYCERALKKLAPAK
jgi:HEAT repeat protein